MNLEEIKAMALTPEIQGRVGAEKYNKTDAEGHVHDSSTGQFTGGGGGGGGESSESIDSRAHKQAMKELKLEGHQVKGKMVAALHKRIAEIKKELEEQEQKK